MDVGPLSRDPEPPGWADFRVYQAWAGRQAAASSGLLITQDVTLSRRDSEAFASALARKTSRITAALTAAGLVATEEPGRTVPLVWMMTEEAGGVLAPWRRDPARQRAAERLASEQDKTDAYFRGDTLSEARRKWLGGTIGLGEFLAAVDRADLAELDQLPRLRRPGPWWRRLLVRVTRAVAGPRRVV